MAQKWQSKSIKSGRVGPRRGRGVPPRRLGNGRGIFKWILAAAVLIGIFYVLFFVLPRVEVVIVPETRQVSVMEEVTLSELADKVDLGSKTIPVAQARISGEESEIFETTGEKDIGERAQGRVKFTNQTGISLEVLVEDGLETLDGVDFVVASPLIVPAASVSPDGEIVPGEVEAEIVALEPGAEGNIEPQRIFISSVPPDRQNKIYAENSEALKGGTSEKVRVASQEDLDEALDKLSDSLGDNLRQAIQEDIDSGLQQVAETFTLVEPEFSASVDLDEELVEFSASLKATGSVYVFAEEDFNELVKNLALSQLLPGEQLVTESPSSISFDVAGQEFTDGRLSLKLTAEWPASPRLDLGKLKAEILGERQADARRILLRDPNVSDVRFRWTTAISRKVPNIPSHVNVTLKAK